MDTAVQEAYGIGGKISASNWTKVGSKFYRDYGANTLPQFSNRPPPVGGWINDENQKDLCDRCINLEARRAAPVRQADGSIAPCRLCGTIPDCPGFIIDEKTLLASVRPKILHEMVGMKKSVVSLEVAFENWPVPAFLSFIRRLATIAGGPESQPQWDKFLHPPPIKDISKKDDDGYIRRTRSFCFPVQSPLDHLANFQDLKPTPTRVGYKSLVLFASGDCLVAVGPLNMEHTAIQCSADDSTPRTLGKVKYSSVFVGHSATPIPIVEPEMTLVSAEASKVKKYGNLPPFADYNRYIRNRIGTMILNAHAEFSRAEQHIQFKPETVAAARGWVLETPEFVNYQFWNHPKLTMDKTGNVISDHEQHRQVQDAKRREEKKRLREEKMAAKREEARQKRIFGKRRGGRTSRWMSG